MHYCLTPLNKDTVLYSVIPLPLEATQKKKHLKAITSDGADIQLLEQDDLPNTDFTFFGRSIAALSAPSSRGKQKKTASTSPPFTALLVGPACSCHITLQSYASWAYVDRRMFSVPHKKHINKSEPKRKAHSAPLLWKEYSLPKVWARATFSTVEVPCHYPQTLQTELQNFFSAPISVKGHAPCTSYEHGEAMAWLYALYAMGAARLIGRTILCHYRSINAQYKLWHASTHSVEKTFPKAWTLALGKTATGRYDNAQEHSPTNATSACVREVMEASDFSTKKLLYNKTKIHHSAIGLAHVRMPILMHANTEAQGAHAYKLRLRRTKNNVSIHIPFVPSRRALEAMKHMVHKTLKTHINTIHIQASESKPLTPNMHSSYAIVGNLLLEGLRKIKHTNTTISVTMPTARYKTTTEAACVVEYNLSMYSKALSPQRIYICMDAGHLARKEFVMGNVEHIVQDALKALFGINTSMRDIPELRTTFMHENTLLYTASIRDALYRAVIEASHDALQSRAHHTKAFPMASAPSLIN